MKKTFTVIVIIALLLCFVPFGSAAQTSTQFTATSPRAAAGSTITVKIRVETVEALAAYKVTLVYDDSILRPLPVENEDYFCDDAGMASWIKMSDAKIGSSSISFLAFSMQSSFTGKTDILCVDFEVLRAYDTAPISLRVDDASNVDCQTVTDASATVVLEPRISGIHVSSPERLVYEVGESLDLTGLSATAFYEDGTERAILLSDLAFSGFSSAQPGEYKVSASYCGFIDLFTVRVKPENVDVLGDANCDGKITLSDVTETAMHVAGIKLLSGTGRYNADVNINGSVTLADVTTIAKHVAGVSRIN